MADYPKLIDPLDTSTEIDETGFTLPEKVALINGWNMIKSRMRRYSNDIFLEFFTRNPRFLGLFRDKEGAIDLENLHAHPYWVLRSLEALIRDGLYDGPQFNLILTNMANCHLRHNITAKEISLMMSVVNSHLKAVLKRFMTPTLNDAFDKLCGKVVECHFLNDISTDGSQSQVKDEDAAEN